MIDHIYIQDADEFYAPAEKPLLEVGLSGDTVMLSVGKVEATDKVNNFKRDIPQIGVPAQDLINAVITLAKAQQREDLKHRLGGDSTIRLAL